VDPPSSHGVSVSRGTPCKQPDVLFAYGAFTRSGGPFQNLQLSTPDQTLRAAPRSLATTSGIFSFPRGTKMFQFPQFPQSRLVYSPCCTWACPHVGFPIRTSPAHAAAHTSPELFAVYRVLRRHLTPQAFTVRPCSFSATPAAETLTFSSRCAPAQRLALLHFSIFACYALGNEPPAA
jgi:hypothetical protein